MKTVKGYFSVILVALLSLAILSGCLVGRVSGEGPENSPAIEKEIRESVDSDIKAEGSAAFLLSDFNSEISGLVKGVQPSVVSIAVRTGPTIEDTGVGSGVIYSDDGYIITNSHVAGQALDMIVTLSDGSNYEGRLIGASNQIDVAVIKIDKQGLTPAKFASIEEQEVGDLVIAVGSPFGIQQTVTMGIISGKGRNLPSYTDQLPIVDLVQTDTAINPGNSGGPLININGEVIGINTLIFSPSGSNAGVGFAIPTDTAVNIAEQIMEYGRAVIPFIGVQLGVNTTENPGAYVIGVVEDSPAEKAGLKEDDIITSFNNKEIINSYQLLAQILRSNCGETIEIQIIRNGTSETLDVELGECPVN